MNIQHEYENYMSDLEAYFSGKCEAVMLIKLKACRLLYGFHIVVFKMNASKILQDELYD